MGHHFKIVVFLAAQSVDSGSVRTESAYLDVVAAYNSNFPVYYHELGVKGSERWPVIVHNLNVDVWYLVRTWQADILPRVRCYWDLLMIVQNLLDIASVVHELDNCFLSSFAGPL